MYLGQVDPPALLALMGLVSTHPAATTWPCSDFKCRNAGWMMMVLRCDPRMLFIDIARRAIHDEEEERALCCPRCCCPLRDSSWKRFARDLFFFPWYCSTSQILTTARYPYRSTRLHSTIARVYDQTMTRWREPSQIDDFSGNPVAVAGCLGSQSQLTTLRKEKALTSSSAICNPTQFPCLTLPRSCSNRQARGHDEKLGPKASQKYGRPSDATAQMRSRALEHC